MYNLIDSHDTERFLYLCREDKTLLKLAVAFQILFPGSPAIYYGDEVGMTGDNDPDCRRCMEWEENADKDVKNWYQKMIQLRKIIVAFDPEASELLLQTKQPILMDLFVKMRLEAVM